ncbi:unnamed protein product [Caenorhabditis auriculariae]|uniref:Uncharacterized protein n=1 Tax=Caenorhabditis auriculariae TaxID=2777116 RepID=A0A8S1HJR2_9PELO|nr:unnamed protein product [Caenorhabditis auriculariae]
MFWDLQTEQNSLVKLLNTKNFTFEQVIEDPFLLQEVRYGNEALKEFFTKEENLVKLVNTALRPKIDASLPLKLQYRKAHICSEVLTVRSVESIYEALVTNEKVKTVMRDFLNDDSPVDHLIAGFYQRIIEHLLMRNFNATFELLKSSSFFEKSLKNLHLGSIEELLENLIKIPIIANDGNLMRQWFVDESFMSRLINCIDYSSPDAVNENAADTYIEIMKELRDKLYSYLKVGDALHNAGKNADLIISVTEKLMAAVENKSSPSRNSVVKACAKILEELIQTNFVMNAPSQHAANTGERKASNGASLKKTHSAPDPLKEAETIASQALPAVLQLLLEDLQGEKVLWRPLLNLILAISNTNFTHTQFAIYKAFQETSFLKIVEAAEKLPLSSMLHTLVQRVVIFGLYTKCEDRRTSPLVEYYLKTCGLLEHIKKSLDQLESRNRVEKAALRTFYTNILVGIYKARKSAAATSLVPKILESSTIWSELLPFVDEYLAKNKVRPSKKKQEIDYSAFDITDKDFLNDSFTEDLDESGENSFDFGQSPTEGNKKDDADNEFEKICSERKKLPSFDNFFGPSETSMGTKNDDWPGAQSEGVKKLSEEWPWPGVSPTRPPETFKTGNHASIFVPDNDSSDEETVRFEGFSDSAKAMEIRRQKLAMTRISFAFDPRATPKKAEDSSQVSEETWPGVKNLEEGESEDWPLNDAHSADPNDAVTRGLANGIALPNLNESHA